MNMTYQVITAATFLINSLGITAASSLEYSDINSSSNYTAHEIESLDKVCSDNECRNDIRMLHRLARHGSFEAMTVLALAYVNGDGVREDIKHGIGLMRIAARHSYAPAVLALSDWYAQGSFVEQDTEESVRLLDRAVQLEYPLAQYRKALPLLISDQENDVAQGIELLKAASEQRLQSAMFLLARLQYQGGFIEQDLVNASEIFSRLTRLGHKEAPNYLRQIITQLKDSEQPIKTEDGTLVEPQELAATLETALDIERIQVIGQAFDFEIESPLTYLARTLDYSGLYQRGSMVRIRGVDCDFAYGCVTVRPNSRATSVNEMLTDPSVRQ